MKYIEHNQRYKHIETDQCVYADFHVRDHEGKPHIVCHDCHYGTSLVYPVDHFQNYFSKLEEDTPERRGVTF